MGTANACCVIDRRLAIIIALLASLIILAVYSGRDIASQVAQELLRLLLTIIMSHYVASRIVMKRLGSK